MYESKTLITKLLLDAVKNTRIGGSIEDMVYFTIDTGEEFVRVKYVNGYHLDICVSMDSGIALMRDVLKELC